MNREKTARKVEKLVEDGDLDAAKGKFKKALKKYHKAYELDPTREGLNEKMIDAHEKSLGEKNWNMEDFAKHMDMVMHKQERDYPPIKQLHAKLGAEWKEASDLVGKILMEEDDAKAGESIERLVAMGEIATRVLIDFLRGMRNRGEE